MILLTDTANFRNLVNLVADNPKAQLYIIGLETDERYRVSDRSSCGMAMLLESCSYKDKFMLYNARLVDGNLVLQDVEPERQSRPVANFRCDLRYSIEEDNK